LDKLTKLYNISKNLTVLYIEDDLRLREKTKAMFEQLFKKIDLANDGESGLLQYETFFYETKNYYDIVITDIQMPKMNGVELASKIITQNKEQKIIVTSAYKDKEDLITFINLGITKFILKPFTTNQIVELLFEVIGNLVEYNKEKEYYLGENLYWNKLFNELNYNGSNIKLSYNETIILNTLISTPNKIFSQFELYDLLLSENDRDFSQDSLKSIIKRLRQKIPYDIIQNIYSQGYKITIF